MQQKKRVMLVDDDSDFVAMNRSVLEQAGYEVVAAHSARECLERVVTEGPDILVLDVMMESEHSGFDLSLELQRRRETRHIPIVLATAIGRNPRDAWRYEELRDCRIPAAAIVDKPVTPQRLLETIHGTLQDW
jgi:CheY-like chemotaxis protein